MTSSSSSSAISDLCLKADKMMRGGGGGFLAFFRGGGGSIDEASDLYVEAANKAKLAKDWRLAADCYMKASYAQEKLKDGYRQASFLQEAGHCLKRVDVSAAVVPYEQATDILAAMGKFGQAGKLMKSLAESLEIEGDFDGALKFYRLAVKYFDSDEYGRTQLAASNQKVAEISARQNKDAKIRVEAAEILEKEAEKALQNSLIQFQAKDLFFKAGLIRIAVGDDVDLKLALEKYEALDNRFASSLEGKMFRKCVDAYIDNNEEKYVAAIGEYDNIVRLDAWKTHFLFEGRSTLQQRAGKPMQVDAVSDSDGELDLS